MNLKQKIIFSLGAGYAQVPYFLEIKKLGYKILACDKNPKAPGKNLVDYFENSSSHNLKRNLMLAKKYNRQFTIHKVVALTTGVPVLDAAIIGKKIGIDSLSIDEAKFSVDKYFLRETLKNIGWSKLTFAKTKDLASAKKFLSAVGKCFLKPNFGGMGSGWVVKITNEEELTKYFLKVCASSRDGYCYLEETAGGIEYKVSTIWHESKLKFLSFEKALYDTKTGIVNGHALGKLPSKTRLIDNVTLEELFKLLKLEPGPVGLDLIVGPKGFEILDIEFVLSDCHLGIEHCSNYNLYKNEARTLVGENVEKFGGFLGACAVRRFLFPSQKLKTLKKINLKFSLKKYKGLINTVLDEWIHGKINTVYGKYQFQGYFVTGGRTQEETIQRSDSVYQSFLTKIS